MYRRATGTGSLAHFQPRGQVTYTSISEFKNARSISLYKTINGALLATELDSGLDFLMRESAYASALENLSPRLLQRVAPVLDKLIAWRFLTKGKCT